MPWTPRRFLPLVLLLGTAACAGGRAQDEPGADGQSIAVDLTALRMREAGRFHRAGHRDGLATNGRDVPLLRFNAFGRTRVQVEASGPGAPAVVVVGPLGEPGTAVVARKVGGAGKLALEVELPGAGAYGVMVGAAGNFAGDASARGVYALDYRCVEGCEPPQVPLAEALREVVSSHGASSVQGLASRVAAALSPEGPTRDRFEGELRGALDGQSANVALLVPLAAFADIQAAIGATRGADAGKAADVSQVPPRDVDLDTAGDDCIAPRAEPAPVVPGVPELLRGHRPDRAIDDCSLARLRALSSALNDLSLGGGSTARLAGKRVTTPGELASALLDSGHTLRVENVRFVADFLGLSLRGASVMAPVWIDTGLTLPGGATLRIPAPHAHHNFWIEGPRFRGVLEFYLGVPSGTLFRVHESIEPAWAGGPEGTGRAEYAFDGAKERDAVIQTFDDAGVLRRKWTVESANLPFGGYGVLGVCADSTAYLEHRRSGATSLYPLLHPHPRAPADDVDRTMTLLPSDHLGGDAKDALRRIARSYPTAPADSPFTTFADAMAALGYGR